MTTTSNPRAIARGFFLATAILPLTMMSCNCRGSGDAHQLGHLAPRTGPDQAAGRRLGEAIALVVEESNADEPSRIDHRPITMSHGDSGGPDLEGFGFQATRMLSVNRVSALIGAVNQDQLARIVSSIQANPNILVTPSGGIIGTPTKLVWPVGLHPAERGKWLAKYAVDGLKVNAVATVTDQSIAAFGATRAGFEAEFRHADRKVLAEWTYSASKELPDLAPRIVATVPKTLLFCGPVAGNSSIFPVTVSMAPKAFLFCGRAVDLLKLRPSFSADSVVLFGGEEEEPILRQDESSAGVIHATAFTTEDPAEKVQKFATDFRNRTGQMPDAVDALSADAARVLLAGGRLAKTFRWEFLVKEMPKVDIELPTGQFWYAKDNEPRRTAYVVRVRRGESELLKSYLPEKK